MARTLEKMIYSLGIEMYNLGVKAVSIRNRKAKLLSTGQKEIWSKLRQALGHGERWIWIHAASLGEFEQGRPLIERLKREHPEYKILLTFFSPSGYEVRKNYEQADCICYLPFDTPGRVRRFLDIVNPEMAIFVKYEFWRNYLEELSRRNIPTYLISAVFRSNQLFFKPWGKWYAGWLKWYTHIYLQDENSRKLLAGVGITDTSVCGDTRFDRVSQIRESRKPIPVIEEFLLGEQGERLPMMMAGSSWPADEDVYVDWFNRNPQVKLVVAPHEFDAARLEKLSARFRNGVVLMNEVKSAENKEDERAKLHGAQVLIIDCFGLLSSAYAYCDVAYVGGAFGAGLHNINEAAVYDVPVIYGPNNKKFIEAQEMAAAGGGLPIAGKADFERYADVLFSSADERQKRGEAAGRYIRSKIGATDRIYTSLFRK